MNRRPPPGGLTFGLRGTSTVYGAGGSRAGRPIVLAGILVALALAIWFLIGRVCGGEDCTTDPYCPTSRSIAVPDGYELATKIFEINPNSPDVKNTPATSATVAVQFPLAKATTDDRNLSFYRYVEESKAWEPLAGASVDPGGTIVSGVFRETPPVVAVLRRLSPAGHVVAYLEHNARLHPDAVDRVTIVHTNDFRPGTDGSLEGTLSTSLPQGTFVLYPQITVTGANKGDLATINSLLTSTSARSAHVEGIVKRANELNLQGVDINYQDLAADKRTVFTLFITELAARLHDNGRKLSVTLPAPIRTGDRIDEGAYDWREIAREADLVQMLPYRDQSTYRLVMPEILDSLLAGIDPARIVLMVTPLATEKSPEGLTTLRITEAMAIAGRLKFGGSGDQRLTTNTEVFVVGTNIDQTENLTGVVWQPATASVAFTYKLNGGRTVWIENFFSVGFKLEYISKYKLGGVAIEDASDDVYLGNIWPALVPFIASGQPILMQPNPNDLAPRWRVTKGTAQQGQNGVLTWTTPAEPGQQSVFLTLSDGVSLFESEIVANVQVRDSRTPAAGN